MNRKQVLLIGLVLTLVFTAIFPVMAQKPTPSPTPEPLKASTSLYATSNFLRANVRSGPSRLYTVLGTIRVGDSLDITGRTTNSSWLRVNFNGAEGWISASLFNVTGDVSTAPVATAGPNAVLRTPASTVVNTKLDTVIVVTKVDSNLRAGASTDNASLAVIPFGTTLTVIGRTAGNNWVRVTFNSQTGWVSSGTLNFTQGNLANAPVVDDSGNPVATPVPTASK